MNAAIDRFRPGPYQWKGWAIGAAGAMVALVWLSRVNYLLFHSLVELFAVVVGTCLFLIAWHSRHRIQNGYLLFVGMAYLWVSLIDLVHTLAYSGMGVFPKAGANLPTQLWIAARTTEASALVGGAFFADTRRVRPGLVFMGYGIATAVLLFLIAIGEFPDCYLEDRGLTPFKKSMEYLISGVLAAAVGLLWKRSSSFSRFSFRLVLWSIVLTIFAEISFTFYISVFGFSNLVGHIFKFASFFLIYLALVRTAFEEPVKILFAELKRREEDLSAERDRLQEALSQVRTLEGLIPICAGCKRIRCDEGYWQEVEVYVRDRTPADFTHSLCPDCAARLYPELHLDRSNRTDPEKGES